MRQQREPREACPTYSDCAAVLIFRASVLEALIIFLRIQENDAAFDLLYLSRLVLPLASTCRSPCRMSGRL
ncbi:hypothetical protein CO676_24365 [Sinorhizobium sp. BJ1]|nr:hypothetical protein CO676_24365 [Sinorhizobium sp. BJ1]